MRNRSNEELLKNYSIEVWQKFHVSHLSYVRNLFIVLSITAIGFIVKLSIDKSSIINYVSLIKISGISFLVSTGSGILLSILESYNYRLKYRIARIIFRVNEEKKVIEDDKEFILFECKCTVIEKINRWLFILQLLSFFAAIFILTLIFLKY